MIPKKIHYCWFGKNTKPEVYEKCLASWKKYCPDYEIIEWNEENFDIHVCPYVEQAYQAGKWAFVTDYARLWIIYNYGGIYLDTDVELVKCLDPLLKNPAFFGIENDGEGETDSLINTGLGFGAEAGNDFVEKMLHAYNGQYFIKADGSYDLTTCPIRNTEAIVDLLPAYLSRKEITVLPDASIYPPEYFCPLDARGSRKQITKNTYSIHWFSATWLTSDEMVVHRYRILLAKCQRILGNKVGYYLVKIIYLFKPKERNILKRM